MAYATGTLNSAVDFPSIFDTFLLANGWTKTVNSSVISGCTITANLGGLISSSHGVNALAAIPLGSKVTFTGSGSANIYTVRRSATSQTIMFSDVTFTTLTAGSATFSWNTYNKGTKYINFAGGVHSQNNIHYIMLDMYHAASGTHTRPEYPQSCRFNPGTSEIPCTYHLFNSGTPDTIVGVFTYGVTTQWFILGDLVKVHSSAYPGGEFLAGSTNIINSGAITIGGTISDGSLGSGGLGIVGGLPFGLCYAPNFASSGFLHAEIDSTIYGISENVATNAVAVTQNCSRKLYRGLNNWNQQALLVVPEIQFAAASSFKSYLGYIEHFRYIRVDNYNLGDTLTLGSDTWKVFPVFTKNTTTRNGSVSNPTWSTGTMGFAVRYVP